MIDTIRMFHVKDVSNYDTENVFAKKINELVDAVNKLSSDKQPECHIKSYSVCDNKSIPTCCSEGVLTYDKKQDISPEDVYEYHRCIQCGRLWPAE